MIDASTPAFPPRTLNLQVVSPGQAGGNRLAGLGYPAIYNDDILQTWVGIGSQITGLTKLGVHDIPPLVGRGILLDMTGDKDMLAAGEHFGEAEVKAVAEAAGVTIGEGDIVLFHTGWTEFMFVLGQARIRGTVQMIINPVALY